MSSPRALVSDWTEAFIVLVVLAVLFLGVLAALATAASANAQTALGQPVEQTASTPVSTR